MSRHRNSWRNKPQPPEFHTSYIFHHEDGTVIHSQRSSRGYGRTFFMIVGTVEGIKAFYEREKVRYPMQGYGGYYPEPEDLGNGLFIGYPEHSESCE